MLPLAHTGEVLGLVNRSGNRPSAEGAAAAGDRALAVCFRGGFQQVLLRGDTQFSQTEHLDRWTTDRRVRFLFGYAAKANVPALAETLAERAGQPLARPPRYPVQTQPRQRPDHVKEAVVVRRAFENRKLVAEQVAEFNYRPTACRQTYRMIVVRNNLAIAKGERVLFDDVRYFFYLTNDWVSAADELVLSANDRCHQENLLAQLQGGVRALQAPVDKLLSNWAYMVMTALARDLKAGWALQLPETPGRWQTRHRAEKRGLLGLEFKTFVHAFMRIPCQLVRTGRRVVYRLLAWNPHLPVFFRVVEQWRC